MASKTCIVLASTAFMWLATPASAAPKSAIQTPAPVQLIRIAQADARAQTPTTATDAYKQLATSRSLHTRLTAEKVELNARYQRQLADVDKLKKRRASWRRDRQIRSQMSKSHRTAKVLSGLAQRIRKLDSRIRADRRALVELIDRELATTPTAGRRNQLLGWRTRARRGLRKHAKKIVLPDDSIDPLADPEELDYQASLLSQSETRLARELALLDKQAKRYDRMVSLRQKYARADEFDRFDNDTPRRAPGGTNRANGAADAEAQPSPPPGNGAESDDSFNENADPVTVSSDSPAFDVVLSEVVDASTVRALRNAGLSSDPAVKARAAKQAREQVKKRIQQLQKRRKLMQKRANKLRYRQ